MRVLALTALMAGMVAFASTANASSSRKGESQVPDAVNSAVLSKAHQDHGIVLSISKKTKDGQVFYRARIDLGKNSERVDVSPDGQLLHIKQYHPTEPATIEG